MPLIVKKRGTILDPAKQLPYNMTVQGTEKKQHHFHVVLLDRLFRKPDHETRDESSDGETQNRVKQGLSGTNGGSDLSARILSSSSLCEQGSRSQHRSRVEIIFDLIHDFDYLVVSWPRPTADEGRKSCRRQQHTGPLNQWRTYRKKTFSPQRLRLLFH